MTVNMSYPKSFIGKRKVPHGKLTEDMVREVRRMKEDGLFYSEMIQILKDKYGITMSKHGVYHICKGKRWKDVV